ncbi:MAG TPA: bifunctional nuclease family protein [Anaerohalosphaeraceae bacterium]|nr:bifunctional nuclease family protein [Anaerohalosphaeraceae bacterium]
MEVPVELSQILINETVDQQIIVLKEKGGQRSFPIVIGMPEILAIDRRLKGYEMPRPLTHDLLASVIEQMGGRILKIVICDLREHTFYARIHIEQNGRVIEVDSRPSDAIALASGLQVPIFVEDSVFDKLQM